MERGVDSARAAAPAGTVPDTAGDGGGFAAVLGGVAAFDAPVAGDAGAPDAAAPAPVAGAAEGVGAA